MPPPLSLTACTPYVIIILCGTLPNEQTVTLVGSIPRAGTRLHPGRPPVADSNGKSWRAHH